MDPEALKEVACDVMANPLVHTLVFIAAVLIPGGLLVYFAWRCANKANSLKAPANHTAQKQGSEDISDQPPTPQEALDAFLVAYPKYSKDSLRARNRAKRMRMAKTRPRKKSK